MKAKISITRNISVKIINANFLLKTLSNKLGLVFFNYIINPNVLLENPYVIKDLASKGKY